MSDSAYHPISGASSLGEALATVEQLLDFAGGREGVEVEFAVRTDSHRALRFLGPAAPGRPSVELHTTRAMLDKLDPHLPDDHRRSSEGLGVDDDAGRVWLTLVPSDTAALAALAELPALPAEVTSDEIPLDRFDPAVIPTSEAAMVEWHLERWPGVPGLPPEAKHAGVALAVNSSGLWELNPAGPGCRLYVVTRASTELGRHAELAAAAVGQRVLGPSEGY